MVRLERRKTQTISGQYRHLQFDGHLLRWIGRPPGSVGIFLTDLSARYGPTVTSPPGQGVSGGAFHTGARPGSQKA